MSDPKHEPVAIIRQLRDLDPINEPSTTVMICDDAASTVEALTAQLDALKAENAALLSRVERMGRVEGAAFHVNEVLSINAAGRDISWRQHFERACVELKAALQETKP